MARRPNKSRKDTTSIMNHTGWGDLNIINDNLKITVPETCITTKGDVKMSVRALLSNLTLENITKLYNNYGVTCEKLA